MKRVINFFLLTLLLGCNNSNLKNQEVQIHDSTSALSEDTIAFKRIPKEKLLSFFPSNEEFMKHYKNESGVYDITSGMMNKLDFICLPKNIKYKHAFINLFHRFSDDYSYPTIIDAVVYTSYLKYGWGIYDTSIVINAFEVISNHFSLMDILPIKIGEKFSNINKALIDTSLSESVFVIKYLDCNMAIKVDADTVKRLFVWKSCHDSLLKYAYNGMAKSLERTIYQNDSPKFNKSVEYYKKRKRIDDSIEFIRLNEEKINNVVDSMKNRDFR